MSSLLLTMKLTPDHQALPYRVGYRGSNHLLKTTFPP